MNECLLIKKIKQHRTLSCSMPENLSSEPAMSLVLKNSDYHIHSLGQQIYILVF